VSLAVRYFIFIVLVECYCSLGWAEKFLNLVAGSEHSTDCFLYMVAQG
jgi:hypothetical protein